MTVDFFGQITRIGPGDRRGGRGSILTRSGSSRSPRSGSTTKGDCRWLVLQVYPGDREMVITGS